jgi:RNA polymerase sigma factor (TIGR02999 family)
MTDVTQILSQIEDGDPSAAEQLLPLVYEELRKLATAKRACEKPGQTLQATALVHEAWLKLAANETQRFTSCQHFFAAAAETMRRILVDQARRKKTVRHGGEWKREGEFPELVGPACKAEETVAIDNLLEVFAQSYRRQAEVTKMRIFLQMTLVEISTAMGLSPDTAETDWAFARAWLKRELQKG